MSASQTLLVFEQNPEDTSFYLVDLESEQAEAARLVETKMHGEDDFTEEENKAYDFLLGWFDTPEGQQAKAPMHIRGANIREVIYFGVYL